MVSQSTAWERRGALSKEIAGLRAGGPALGAGGPGKRFVPKAEIEPVHSIASSAVASNDGEIAISSSFVVLEVDDRLELGRLLDRDISGLRAFENKIDNLCVAPPLRAVICPVGHKTSCFNKLAVTIDSG